MDKTIVQTSFETDILRGLRSEKKFIPSKYFYDDEGSRIFRKIMRMKEYYLTDCEYEIFETHSLNILKRFENRINQHFDLVELGAGDGLKTSLLINCFLENDLNFKYIPVDISEEAISILTSKMEKNFPSLVISAIEGDYFEVLNDLNYCDQCPRLVLFLGSNIGNYSPEKSIDFYKGMSEVLKPGDMILTGFDLKKDPDKILLAYDDPHGYTRDFNLNLLTRINRELKADFDLSAFKHHAVYDPESGIARSFLVSIKDQYLRIGEKNNAIHFSKWESIYTEMSRKFSIDEIEKLAERTGFNVLENYFDSKHYFTDSLWIKK